ncbi:hypothetical protein LGM43_35635 [Burkholderia seminalis]|nr:hypothetical protein [Burkholderia seminalis]
MTLIETAVALAVSGLLAGILMWVLTPVSPVASATDIESIINAIVGYALSNQSLPPAGWLNPSTVGLPNGNPIWYTADKRLQGKGTAYTPDPYQHVPQFIGANGQSVTWQSLGQSSLLNFCQRLIDAQQAPQLMLGGIPVAFEVQLGHKTSAAPPGSALLPGSQQAQQQISQGTQVYGVGLGELLSRLSCPAKLANAGSAAKSILDAQDMTQVGQSLLQFDQLKYQNAQYSQLSDDLQEAIRAWLAADLVADIGSTTVQLIMGVPSAVETPNFASLSALAVAMNANGIMLSYLSVAFQMIAHIKPGDDTASIQSAQNAMMSAGRYVAQFQQLQQGRQNHYQAVLQGS